jgi:hypothetical protein
LRLQDRGTCDAPPARPCGGQMRRQ